MLTPSCRCLRAIKHTVWSLSLLVFTSVSSGEVPSEGATLTEVIASGDSLRQELNTALRSLKYPQTIATEEIAAIDATFEELRKQLLRWKNELETVLREDTATDRATAALETERKAYLLDLYFGLLANLLQVKKIILKHIDWLGSGAEFTLQVPRELVWSPSQTLQRLFTQRVKVTSAADEGYVRLQLQDAFIDGIQIASSASHPDTASHLAAVKYLIYLTLYNQLVQNEHYRGKHAEQLPLAPPQAKGIYELDLRARLIDYQRAERRNLFLHAALLESMPRLQLPATGLVSPLLDNWHLYEQLRAAHPDLLDFTTAGLAQQLFTMLNEQQRQAIGVSDAEEFRRFLLLVEYLNLPVELEKELRRNPLPIDDRTVAQTLPRLATQARQNALLSTLMQLRIARTHINTLLEAMRERRATLLALDEGQTAARWYERAKKLVPDLQQRARVELIRELFYAAWKVDTAEQEGAEPVNLPILRRSLLLSLYTIDFSGEFQQSLAAILQAQGYPQSRAVFFSELSRHLQRLAPQQQPNARLLGRMTQDDIIRTYVNPALPAAATAPLPAAHAVQRKATMHHITQVKSLLQHGHWFGYFTNKGEQVPSVDELPLDERQRAAYFSELRYAWFDRYPFMLLPVPASKQRQPVASEASSAVYVAKKQELYKVLAAQLHDRELDTLGTEELNHYWPLVAQVLDEQQQRIHETIRAIDAADSLQDIKHLAANSPLVNAEMRKLAGLYPRHEEFTNRYTKPSQLQHSWERIDLTYIGGFFTVIIGWHLGGWLLRKSVPASYLLRYLTPTFGAIAPYTNILMGAFWYVILFDYFGIKVWQTFVSKPRKLNELREYYYLGNQRDRFVTHTHLNYLSLERKSHIANYAMEAAMLGIFVAWMAYNISLPHLVPSLKNARLQRLFARIGVRKKDGSALDDVEAFERRHEIFDPKFIREKAAAEVEAVKAAVASGTISRRGGQQQIHRIELARDKIFTSMAKKERAIRVAEIEHTHDFRALGLTQPAFRKEEIEEAYGSIVSSHLQNRGKSLLSDFALRDAEIAMMNIGISLSRRLKFQIIRSRGEIRAKIGEMSSDAAYGKDLDMFGIPRNQRDTFSDKQLTKAQRKFDSMFSAAERTAENPYYERAERSLQALRRAVDELQAFRIADGWHSAMFEAIIDRRFANISLHSGVELLKLEECLRLLEVSLVDSEVSTEVASRGELPSFKLSHEWETIIARRYESIAKRYHETFKDETLQEKLQELGMARDLLLNPKNVSAIRSMLTKAHYENYYRVLGLDPKLAETYTKKDIRQAYRDKAAEHHPDKHPDKDPADIEQLNKQFHQITRAQEVLGKTKSSVDAYLQQYYGDGL